MLPKQNPPVPIFSCSSPTSTAPISWAATAIRCCGRRISISIAARGTAFDQLLCRKPGLPAEPRQPDDRADAVGARRAEQRHSAVDGGGDLRRSAARRRLPHRAGRQEPSAELHRRTIRSSSGRRRARAFTSRRRDSRQSLRDHLDDPKYEQETPGYWTRAGAHVQTPFYGFDHVDAGARPRRRGRRRLRPLARCARSQGEKSAGTEEQPAARLQRAAGLSHGDPGGALRHRRSSASAPAPISTRPKATTRSS